MTRPRRARSPLAFLALVALLAPLALFLAPTAPSLRAGEPAGVEVKDGVSVLVLEGSHRERGLRQGRAFARAILAAAGELARVKKESFPDEAAQRSLLGKFTWDDDVSKELEGILAGVAEASPRANVPGLDRGLTREDLEGINTLADLLPFGCSSFTISGEAVRGGGTLTGRNLDYRPFESMLVRLVVVRAPSEGRRGWATVSWPGVVGAYTGMNDQGVTASIHDVRTGRDALARTGFVPRSIGIRRVLEKTAKGDGFVARAADVLRETPVIYGNNVHVSGPRATNALPAAILEWGPERDEGGGVTVREQEEGEPLVCTNHWRARAKPAPCGRYAALVKAVKERKEPWTPEAALEALRASAQAGSTLHSVVFAPEARTMLLAFASARDRSAPFEHAVALDLGALFDAAGKAGH